MVDLFAGMPVTDYERAVAWYELLLGSEPSFLPNEVEAVWELGEHAYVYVEVRPEHAGHARNTIFVADFEERIAAAALRGIDVADRETYENGVRHATYRDPDGNEFCLGGPPEGSPQTT
ncbi:MAG: VOC family protein [Propionibacteriales bacterium]|jgi:catechol 2,3-dioxygenase-like lactoylglutathione lyase family enzyme|nr:VOC family protein [Propionibacteriales bacterium]